MQHIDKANAALPKQQKPAALRFAAKVLAAAIPACALWIAPAFAASSAPPAVALTSCPNHGASVLFTPPFSDPDENAVGKEAVLSVDLTAAARVQNIAVKRSTGDPQLDFLAMSIVRESRYAAATVNCNPVADQFLYDISF